MRLTANKLSLACLTLASACAAPVFQSVPRPDENSAVAADRCRVYLTRSESLGGSLRDVRIVDDGVVIGRIGNDEYLCWDRLATMGVGQAFYEGIDPTYGDVENVFELPRAAGTTAWLAVSIGKLRKPEIVPLTPDEGRALIAKRRAAPLH